MLEAEWRGAILLGSVLISVGGTPTLGMAETEVVFVLAINLSRFHVHSVRFQVLEMFESTSRPIRVMMKAPPAEAPKCVTLCRCL